MASSEHNPTARWKRIPKTIGVTDRRTGKFIPDAPVTRIELFPPGSHPPGSVIRKDVTLALIHTPYGTRQYGFAEGCIDSSLRMRVKLSPGQERDEVVARWPNTRGGCNKANEMGDSLAANHDTALMPNQASALPWLVGLALVGGAIFLVTRPKKAAAASGAAQQALPPPPPATPSQPQVPPTSCSPTKETLNAWGAANNAKIVIKNAPPWDTVVEVGVTNAVVATTLYWNFGETMLRAGGFGGPTDQVGTASYCQYLKGLEALVKTIQLTSGPHPALGFMV